jgi:hypothetical protein
MPSLYWIQSVVFPLAGMGLVAFFGLGIYKTINHVIERKMNRGVSPREIEALRAELDAIRSEQAIEIAEIYDRLEFTDQLLNRSLGQEDPPKKRKLTPAKSVFP